MMKRSICIVAVVISAVIILAQRAEADDGDKDCIKTITTIENIFDGEKAQFKDDRCKLVKAAKATRGAMLDEIARHPDQCGLKEQFVDLLKNQQSGFEAQAAEICR